MSLSRALLPAVVGLMSSPTALAQATDIHHPVVPSAGIATENGPGTLWVNPANLSYDVDPRYALFFSRVGEAAGPTSFALTGGTGTMGAGAHLLQTTAANGESRSDWSLDYSLGLPLPERVSIGLGFSWNFIDEGQNYVGYDAGLSWRPLPWVGFGAVAQNISSPDPSGVARPRTGAGLAVRPFGRFLVLGVDFARTFAPDGDPSGLEDEDLIRANARLRPLEGLYVRGGVDASKEPEGGWSAVRAALGLELYFDGLGAGYHQDAGMDGGVTRTAWLGSDEPGESLFRSGRRVPTFTLQGNPPYEPRETFFSPNPGASWLEILELVRRVDEERGVRGLVLTLGSTDLGWARYRELRERLVALERTGTKVLVHLQGSPSTGEYYVASAASRITVHPAGEVRLVGIAFPLLHVRGALEVVGVEPQYVRRDTYKSAPDTFTRTEPSEASLEQTNALLDDLYGELVDAIAEGRHLTPAEVRDLIDGGPYTAEEAVEVGLVDAVLYPDMLELELARMHEGAVQIQDLTRLPQSRSPWEEPQQIALVYVDGVIVPGESSEPGLVGPTTAGSTTIARALVRAAEEPLVRAVVLRVDSPGGSSFASDEIWRAVELVRREGKPVVVSMGGVAASGGYYVAAGADAIWAEPNTITGSIGVYSGKMVAGELLEEIGVSATTLVRGRNADLDSPARRWDEEQQARMQAMIDGVYRQFVDRVSEGRRLTPEAADAVAGGRVWSGRAAKEVGLVDGLGGLQDAIADARRRAGIPEARKVGLVSYTSGGTPLEQLAPALVDDVRSALVPPSDRAALSRLGDALAPLSEPLLWTMYPDERVWLLAPELVEASAR